VKLETKGPKIVEGKAITKKMVKKRFITVDCSAEETDEIPHTNCVMTIM